MKRSSSSRKRLEVFDFSKEDERVESVSEKFLAKFASPGKPRYSPLSKYTFLRCFTPWIKSGSKKMSDEPIVVDDSTPDRQSVKSVTHVLQTSPEDGARLSDHESKNFLSEANSFSVSRLNLEVTSDDSKCVDTTLTKSLSNCETIGVISDDESITSSFAFDLCENEVFPEEPARECGFDGNIIYPEGDPDAVSISKRDVELLKPERFINDTIIDFFIKYLKNKIRPEERHRFHFFNCFFFRKLADLDKDPSSVSEGRAAFQRVRKWTWKVNLFEKDYIFIPVNFSLHWSLIVICHPGEVTNFKDEEIDKSPRVPCILHMDSKKGSHRGLKNLVQSYLFEEWRERQSETPEDMSSKFLNLPFVPLELPQQENSFDCGLFLLHYVELFLEGAPVNFSPFQITNFSNFLNRDWFRPADASLKRAYIQKLIFEILEDNSQKISPADCNDKCPSSQLAGTVQRKSVIELFEDMCSSTKTCNGTPSGVYNEQVSEISVVATSPQTGVKYIGKSELFPRQFFEQGTTAGSLPNELPRKSIMSPIEEVEEIEEQVSDTPLSEPDCHNGHRIPEPSKTSHFTGNCQMLQTSGNPGIHMYLEEHEDGDLFSGSSVSGSRSSSWADNNNSPKETVGSHRETDEHESASMSCEELADCVVEDSQEADEMHDGNTSEDSIATFQGNIIDLCREEATSCVNIDLKMKNMPSSSYYAVGKTTTHGQPLRRRQLIHIE